jgi:hypothetical protein
MDQRHQEYLEYYKARMVKYEGNPLYPNSYAAEKAVYDALASCTELGEFKQKLQAGNLNVKVALALVKDQEIAEKKHWEELNEPIKARGCQRILDVIDTFTDINTMITETNNLRQQTSMEISIDGFTDYFYNDFGGMENIEEYAKAEIPDKWKSETEKSVAEMYADAKKLYEEVTLPRTREWSSDWNMNYDLIWEDRHRRVIPVPDATIKRLIPEHKKFWSI